MRVTRSLLNNTVEHRYERPSSLSMSLPDDSLSLREILDNWSKGIIDPRSVEHNVVYDSESGGNMDLDSDIIDNVRPSYTEVFERRQNAQNQLNKEIHERDSAKASEDERRKLSDDIASALINAQAS